MNLVLGSLYSEPYSWTRKANIATSESDPSISWNTYTTLSLNSKLLKYTVRLKYSLTSCEYFSLFKSVVCLATGPLPHIMVHAAFTFAPAFMSSFTIDSCSLITARHNGVHSNVYCLLPGLPLPFTTNVFVYSRSTFTDAFHNSNCGSLRFLLLTATHIGWVIHGTPQYTHSESRFTFAGLNGFVMSSLVIARYPSTQACINILGILFGSALPS